MPSYGSVKRAVLELINQYTVAGEDVPLSYNNQADYVGRIPGLLNQAVTKIRTTRFPLTRTAYLSEGELHGAWVRYALPSDCREVLSGGVWRMTDRGPERQGRFRVMGRDIWLPALALSGGRYAPPEAWADWSAPSDGGGGSSQSGQGYAVEYRAYPLYLPPDPADEYEWDETAEVLQAAAYYAAAQLVMMEDQYAHANLMNEYESRLAAMAPPLTAELHSVRNVYSPDER